MTDLGIDDSEASDTFKNNIQISMISTLQKSFK